VLIEQTVDILLLFSFVAFNILGFQISLVSTKHRFK